MLSWGRWESWNVVCKQRASLKLQSELFNSCMITYVPPLDRTTEVYSIPQPHYVLAFNYLWHINVSAKPINTEAEERDDEISILNRARETMMLQLFMCKFTCVCMSIMLFTETELSGRSWFTMSDAYPWPTFWAMFFAYDSLLLNTERDQTRLE